MSGASDQTVQIAELTATVTALRAQLKEITDVAAAAVDANAFLAALYTALRA
jgi:hypothetical protein